jgi:hypothetical protein
MLSLLIIVLYFSEGYYVALYPRLFLGQPRSLQTDYDVSFKMGIDIQHSDVKQKGYCNIFNM